MAPADLDQESQPTKFSLLVPDGRRSLPVQAKLTIGAPNAPYEQESDRVAAHVVQQNGEAPNSHSALSRSPSFPINSDLIKPVLQRAILPIKTGNAQEDVSIDHGVKFLNEGKKSNQTGKIEANARGKLLNGNAYNELKTITNMQETIYIIGHSDGKFIGGHNSLEVADLLNQNLPPLFQGKIVLVSCHTAEHSQTQGFGKDQLRSKALPTLTDDDKKRIQAYNMAKFKGYIPAALPAELEPLVTTFAQAVAIKLYQLRAASGITPSSVQGFKGTGSLLAQVGGKDVGVEQSARMLVKTDEAKKKIDADYADWENTVYQPAIQALKTRQAYKPKPIKDKSKLKQISHKIGFTNPDLDSPPSCQDQPWLLQVSAEVQQVLDPSQTPSRQDFDAAYLMLKRASIQRRNDLFIHHGRFGKDAKAVYAVDATGSQIEKAAKSRRKAIGKQSQPLKAPSPLSNIAPSPSLISSGSALPQLPKPSLDDSTMLNPKAAAKEPIVQGTVLSLKLPSQDEKTDAD